MGSSSVEDGWESKPPKKRLKHLSPQQIRALEKIANFSANEVVGIDEVGVGCWAGPVTVAAVVMPRLWDHPEVVDSKRLTHEKRMKAWNGHILPNALSYVVLSKPSSVIDREGIDKVVKDLTEEVAMYCRLRYPSSIVVQDGNVPVAIEGSVTKVVWTPKADVLIPAVSAASILAKVSRDLFMMGQEALYPGYDFASNKGYHSKRHVEGLTNLGVCAIHRRSYKPIQTYAQAKDASSW